MPRRVVRVARDEFAQHFQAVPCGGVRQHQATHERQPAAQRRGERDGFLDLRDRLGTDLVLHGQLVLRAERAPLAHHVGIERGGELEHRGFGLRFRARLEAKPRARVAHGTLHAAPQCGGFLGDAVRQLAHLRLVAQATGDHGADRLEHFLLGSVHLGAFLVPTISSLA